MLLPWLLQPTVVSSDNQYRRYASIVGVHVEINNENNENQAVQEDGVVDAFIEAAEQSDESVLETDNAEQTVDIDASSENDESITIKEEQTEAYGEHDLSELPSNLRELFESTLDQNQQLSSRTNKLQNDLRASNGRLRKMQQAAATARDNNPIQKIDIESLEDENINAMKEDFPEVVGGFQTMANAVNKNIENSTAQVDAIVKTIDEEMDSYDQVEADDYAEEQLSLLAKEHPDYETVNASPEFATWLSTQPKNIASMQQSGEATDLIYLFDLYAEKADSNKRLKSEDILSEHQSLSRSGTGRLSAESDDPIAIFAEITS